MPWFLWQLSVILHEGLWFKGTHIWPFPLRWSQFILYVPCVQTCSSLWSHWAHDQEEQASADQAESEWSAFYSCRFQGEKNKQVGATLSFQAQLQPRSLLIAEVLQQQCKKWSAWWKAAGAGHPHSLPSEPSQPWHAFLHPPACPGLGSTFCWRLELWNCEPNPDPSRSQSSVSLLPPSSDLCWLGPSQPWILQKLHSPLLSD